MMQQKDIETFYPASRKQWRQWLQKNHEKKPSIWLIQYKKASKKASITWEESVEEALCFGWIDGTRKSIDHEKFIQFFTKRKPKSVWSKINKGKAQKLIDEGLMTQAGYESIEVSKKNGYWSIMDKVEELTVPKDLEKEFKLYPGSKTYFKNLSKSVKKMMLAWITLAKRPETRQKRITEIAEMAGKETRPKQFM